MTSGDHNLIPSERGELARSGGETHPILSEMAGGLLASVKQKDELAPARPKDELAQPKGELVPQGSRIGDPKIMLYETSTGEKFHHIFFREPLFWISFSCVNEWGLRTRGEGEKSRSWGGSRILPIVDPEGTRRGIVE